ncbi:peptidase S10 [Trinickia caryophylli]|uniref:Carboxypeptidase C (Cathepsin A) n=1 Tax=Trinickia caryophylli TaxID=28094 RepID=A0A1X7D083_TRICW|nr:peptidase S10 [Trinickia caryophylli]PMS13539.1 peptidase S10 [Trinickia caryophylli]TRX15295.1 peptidase S10 [Trinickia caryophylli]TRX15801.1 peptidase S10 [Trinickia caryophylli]TRX15811.1 peptidase S10 [Trinickia caryophylli]WQE15174.1 peptidase S10 [Trinickia caryophylli]
MKPDRSVAGSDGRYGRCVWLGAGIVAALILSGCGGGDGGSSGASSVVRQTASADAKAAQSSPTANQPYTDPIAYSPKADDGLDPSQVAEKAAVMHYTWTSGSKTIDYTTTTGHLTAIDSNGRPEATMSYVAYTAPSTNGAPRPVTFFYNGGPGSSSIWLRLGSFAPTRVATPDPLLTNWPNYPLVPNAESLIDTTDMVFIDPPGTGLSEAILPNTNKTFWGCDPDVVVMRDFIERYLAANKRGDSPIYLYGESYGTPRTDMLALSLETAGVHLSGIVLQSSILNYFADAIEAVAITSSTAGLALDTDTLSGYLPAYAEVAAYFNQVQPAPIDDAAYAWQVEQFVKNEYRHFKKYSQTWVLSQLGIPDALGKPVLPSMSTLASWTWGSGMTMQALNGYFNREPFSTTLLPGTTIGRYDGRVSLPNSDPRLQTDSDPSDILIAQPFATALQTQLPNYLGYTAPNATFMPLNEDIIQVWDFSHAGQPLPDTVPDLLAALTLDPQLKVLAENGYHDLATPFFSTEKELARLQSVPGLNPYLAVNFFAGGHMTYLDDTARPQMKSQLAQFYAGLPIPGSLGLRMLPPPWRDEAPADEPTGPAVATQAAAL